MRTILRQDGGPGYAGAKAFPATAFGAAFMGVRTGRRAGLARAARVRIASPASPARAPGAGAEASGTTAAAEVAD
ncbi:hypothetical protein ACWGRF_13400 [Streptomyces zhihengii]